MSYHSFNDNMINKEVSQLINRNKNKFNSVNTLLSDNNDSISVNSTPIDY